MIINSKTTPIKYCNICSQPLKIDETIETKLSKEEFERGVHRPCYVAYKRKMLKDKEDNK